MSSLSLPTIWTPGADERARSASWWSRHLRGLRDRLSVFTAGKEQRNPANGKAKRNATNGKTKNNTDTSTACCCGCPGDPCASGCVDGTTPIRWKFSWSGINLCLDQCIAYNSVEGAKLSGPTATLSGTASANQEFGVPCLWGDIPIGNSNPITFYTDHTCATVDSSYPNIALYLRMIKIPGSWNLRITGLSGSSPLGGVFVFSGSIPTVDPIDCMTDSLAFTNIYTTCGSSSGSGGNFGYGGTVVATPCL